MDIHPVDELEINRRVGPTADVESDKFSWIQEVWDTVSRSRCDVVVRSGSTWYVIELSPFLGSGSFGEVLVYAHWLHRDEGIGRANIHPVLLGREFAISIMDPCIDKGISLGKVTAPGTIDWVYGFRPPGRWWE